MGSRVFRSKKDISKHLTAQQKSNLSVPAYCKKHGIPPSTFFNWQKRNGTREVTSQLSNTPFAQLTLPSSHAANYEIVKNDFTIRVPMSFEPSVLRRIIEVLS